MSSIGRRAMGRVVAGGCVLGLMVLGCLPVGSWTGSWTVATRYHARQRTAQFFQRAASPTKAEVLVRSSRSQWLHGQAPGAAGQRVERTADVAPASRTAPVK